MHGQILSHVRRKPPAVRGRPADKHADGLAIQLCGSHTGFRICCSSIGVLRHLRRDVRTRGVENSRETLVHTVGPADRKIHDRARILGNVDVREWRGYCRLYRGIGGSGLDGGGPGQGGTLVAL